MSRRLREAFSRAASLFRSFGVPRLIIAGFLLLLFIIAPFADISVGAALTDVFARFGQNAIMVLAMVPMIHSGCGLNFGLPLGIISGLLGATLSLELGIQGPVSFLLAIVFSTPFALLLGWLYAALLNRVKGSEMMIATYVGFSSVAFMSIMWLVLPYHSPTMVWGYTGQGLRTTISTSGYYYHVLRDLLSVRIGSLTVSFGEILFFAFFAALMWAFLRTKTGMSMTATGASPAFARASGVRVNSMRTLSVIMSTWLGALGILCYEQGYGFIQLYQGPMYMAMPAVSAILIGGATVNRATIPNVIIGTILYQGIVSMTPAVMNNLIHTDMSEVLRIIVSNGMILYALTRKTGASK